MNTDLNDYHDDYYEKYSICEIDEENIVIIDDDEAIHKNTVIQLIRPLAKVSFYLIFELAKTLLNVALCCLNFD